jgi:hypothetical protein
MPKLGKSLAMRKLSQIVIVIYIYIRIPIFTVKVENILCKCLRRVIDNLIKRRV